MKNLKSSEFFHPFRPFSIRIVAYLKRRRFFPVRTSFGYVRVSKDYRKSHSSIGKSRLFVRAVAIVVHTSSQMYLIVDFGANTDFFVMLAGNFGRTKSPREYFLVAYDRCPLHPTSSRTS